MQNLSSFGVTPLTAVEMEETNGGLFFLVVVAAVVIAASTADTVSHAIQQ